MAGTEFPLPQPITEDRAAKKAFRTLVGASCDAQLVASLLAVLHLLALTAHRHRGDPTLPGMARRTLNRLPGRIRDVAEIIERVNTHTFFDPERWLPRSGWQQPVHRALMLRELTILPGVLRRCADHIEVRARLLGQFRRGPGRGDVAVRRLLIYLLRYVRKATGQPFYEAIANLLSPILPSYGSAELLRQLYRRHPS